MPNPTIAGIYPERAFEWESLTERQASIFIQFNVNGSVTGTSLAVTDNIPAVLTATLSGDKQFQGGYWEFSSQDNPNFPALHIKVIMESKDVIKLEVASGGGEGIVTLKWTVLFGLYTDGPRA